MQNHFNLKTRTRKCELIRSLNTISLYAQPWYGHNISALARLRKMAAYMIIQQFRGMSPVWHSKHSRNTQGQHNFIPENINYVSLWVSLIFQWYMVCTEVKTIDQIPHLQLEGLPKSFRWPPIYKRHIWLCCQNILACSCCGLKHQYGIPYQHLFSLEPEYDLGDINYSY
jgi:hypothetical protein